MQLISEDDVVATYDRSDPTAAELVADYREFEEYYDEHPDESAYKISQALDQPRSRLREWVDGARPDALHALDEMRDRGWLSDMPSPETRALNQLVARVLTAGYVVRTEYTPAFMLHDDETLPALAGLFDTLGFEHTLVDEDDHRPEEVRVKGNAQLLGRALVAAGGARGRDRTNVIEAPSYLNYATTDMRREFLWVWILERGAEVEGDDWELAVELHANRAASFVDDMATLFGQEAGASQVERVGRVIYLTETGVARIVD